MMSKQIQRALLTFLSKLKWRTHKARQTTLKAVTEMTMLIGYPDWMDDEDAMEERFSNVRNFTEQSPFVRIYEEYRRAAFDDLMKKLSTPYSATNEWSGSPTDATFGYDASSNTIYLPAGVLQPPLYSLNYPEAVNYGKVGVMIAHDMARALHAQDIQSVGDKSTCSKITLEEYYETNPVCQTDMRHAGDYFSFDEELLCTMMKEYDIRKCETGGTTVCRINELAKIPEFRQLFQCNRV
ncbi:endothelin-converting enzyme homolog [Rhipicephalus microplus]|uniref:endothelin-converting enzyme homolog n=1 Tax=Rhipicephalus microplus TaxID=6941 RepID=UPI003F6ACED4